MHAMIDASSIRAYADGELSPQEAAAFEKRLAADPDLAARVRFEAALRGAVGRSMASPAGGIDAEALRAAMAGAGEIGEVAPSVAGRVAPARRSRVNVFAVAACLALVCGAVLYGIFGQPIHLIRGTSPGDGSGTIATTAAAAVREHSRCAINQKAADAKCGYHDEQAIHDALDPRLGAPVPIIDLRAAGYDLAGAGPCGLEPTPDHTVHLLYRHASGGPCVSIFVQPDVGMLELIEGRFRESGAQCAALLKGDLVLIIVACNPTDLPAIEALVHESPQLP
jgi:anti-sigma factor RsiW